MDYYWSEEDQRDWKLPDTIRYYKKLAEIAGRAHRELTNDDFEAFCGTFDMSENTDRRRHMFELFAAFDVGFVRTKKSDFFV
jgi:hypothetical protein